MGEVMSNLPPDYSERIKSLRLRLKLTQVELAAKVGVSFASVNRWENGWCKPSNLCWARLLEEEKPMSDRDDCIKELALRLARCRENNYAAGTDATRDSLLVALADKVVELQSSITSLEDKLSDHERRQESDLRALSDGGHYYGRDD